jgi:hypothetical protein
MDQPNRFESPDTSECGPTATLAPIRPDLEALVYVSTATHRLSAAEIDHLLERARARNLQEGVTGVLLYSHGNFMQYLEGSASAMTKIFDIIKADPLHRNIIELLHEPIQSRAFGEWSMAFRSISAFGVSTPPQLDAVFSAQQSPAVRSSSTSHKLLWNFWNKGICPGAAQTAGVR